MFSYVYSWSPAGAKKNHLGSCSFAWNTSTMLPLGRRQTVEPQDRWYWAAELLGCFGNKLYQNDMAWKRIKGNTKPIDIQLTFNWLMLTCWSQVSYKDHFTKNQRTMFNSRDQWSHVLSQANLCGSIKNLRHRLLLASNGIGGNSLSALHWKPTKHTAMELNCAELCT